MSAAGRPSYDALALGDTVGERTFALHRIDLVRYAGASGDLNPIHWNERTARAVGLPDVIAHGMLSMGTAVRLVTDWCGDPGAVVGYGARFTNPVPVPDDESGADLVVAGTVAAKDDAARTVRVDLAVTHQGRRVLGRAQVTVKLD